MNAFPVLDHPPYRQRPGGLHQLFQFIQRAVGIICLPRPHADQEHPLLDCLCFKKFLHYLLLDFKNIYSLAASLSSG